MMISSQRMTTTTASHDQNQGAPSVLPRSSAIRRHQMSMASPMRRRPSKNCKGSTTALNERKNDPAGHTKMRAISLFSSPRDYAPAGRLEVARHAANGRDIPLSSDANMFPPPIHRYHAVWWATRRAPLGPHHLGPCSSTPVTRRALNVHSGGISISLPAGCRRRGDTMSG